MIPQGHPLANRLLPLAALRQRVEAIERAATPGTLNRDQAEGLRRILWEVRGRRGIAPLLTRLTKVCRPRKPMRFVSVQDWRCALVREISVCKRGHQLPKNVRVAHRRWLRQQLATFMTHYSDVEGAGRKHLDYVLTFAKEAGLKVPTPPAVCQRPTAR
ncbi:hypothetical protein ACFL59_10245 [Planctomycetota bacterium]